MQLRKSTREFQHRSYNLLTCNCHSFVANNLNRLGYGGSGKWNVVNLAARFSSRVDGLREREDMK
ncbi:hypothetical protein Scep_000599 [Stephania cephalantha]|uniref:PPPDE domain-containing protein n=1 Tax=Stephania cephalantha TaxID=152367 RepID=A0AAP0L7W3_9MAGN